MLCSSLLFTNCKKSSSPTPTTPTTVKITSVKITGLPFTNSSCSCTWDFSTGPDVYFVITDNVGTVLKTSSILSNVSPSSLPMTYNFTTPFQTNNFYSTYYIWVYDNDTLDSPSNPDDTMGGYYFTFSDFISSSTYPTTTTLQNPTSSLSIDLTLQWQ